MSSILKIVFKGALATGMSGFPVGIASFVKNSNFQSRGEIMQKMKAIQTSEQLVSEKQNQRDQIKAEVDGLHAQVSAVTQNVEKNANDASTTLRKMMKLGMQSCQEKEKKGLIEAKEKLQINGQEKEITFCYYTECDENLFLKKKSILQEWDEYNTFSIDSQTIKLPFKKACFSISTEHNSSGKKITGEIKMALKSETNNITTRQRGMLFATEFEFSESKSEIKHTALLLSQSATGKIWNIVKGKKLEETATINDKKIYSNLKNSINSKYKSLNILETGSKVQNMNLNTAFDLNTGFNMWKDFMNEIKNVYDLKNIQKKVLNSYKNTLEKKTDSWWEVLF